MTSNEEFSRLFSLPETDLVDFKLEPPLFLRVTSEDRAYSEEYIAKKKSEFIKDILSMANTPRETSAFLIYGVKLHTDGTHENIGITEHPDDSDLHDILNNAKIEQKPHFMYQPINYEGKSYGIIEIPIQKDGPYFPTKDFGGLKAHSLYFRRGTKNDEAITTTDKKNLYKWFLPSNDSLVQLPQDFSTNDWNLFSHLCHNFTEDRLYIFVIGKNPELPIDLWSNLSKIPVNLVFDFDPNTNSENGIFFKIKGLLKNSYSVHLITLCDKLALIPDKACYWYPIKGLINRTDTLVSDDWRSWNRKYGRPIQDFLKEYAYSTNGKPITVICLYHAPEYLREICSSIDQSFGEAVEYIFAYPESERDNLADQFTGANISIKPQDILFGIQNNFATKESIPLLAGIPDNTGSFKVINESDLNWLSEDMEILHSNIEISVSENLTLGNDYLRGYTITWNDLNLHIDADRDVTDRLEELIVKDLDLRTPTRINILHNPGAGGTTIARRIGWNLRRRFPTLLLNKIVPGETIAKFRFIYSLTSQPIFAIVEGSDVVADLIEQFFTEIRAEQIPLVILSVLRRFEIPRNSGDRTIIVTQTLSSAEIYRFIQIYKRFTPEKEKTLDNFLLRNGSLYHTPFYIGLICFEENFTGLKRYIEAKLNNSQQIEKEIMTLISLIYYYGHRSISSQIFAELFGIPGNRIVDLNRLLPKNLLDLLIQEIDNEWRPAHQLIAEEIITETLSQGTDRRNWPHGLSIWAIKLIRILDEAYLLPSNKIVEILRRVFILRDEYELLGTESSDTSEYSKFIEDIPSIEGKLAVFKELVNSFPNYAHFWGHLGRFYSSTMKDYENALIAIENAINLEPLDPVLHHMKGMCHRRIVTARLKEIREGNLSFDEKEFIELVNKSKDAFSKSRELDPSSEHSYISEIQLLLIVLDYGFQLSGFSTKTEWLISRKAQWFTEQLDKIESLLEQGKLLQEGEKASKYLIDCQSKVDLLYDNYSQALQGWQNLLDRKDSYAPPIRRQIIRVYLARNKRQWNKIPANEVERIIKLAEQNLIEEPGSLLNIRIWFQAVRYSSHQDIDQALDNLTKWKSLGDSIEAYYYSYILHALKAIKGSILEVEITKELIRQSNERSKTFDNRNRSFEWLGQGKGLNQIIHYLTLGEWDTNRNFFENSSNLLKLEGYISDIKGPQAGKIQLSNAGLEAFFVPGRTGIYKGRDENRRVEFFLGFCYSGLRAWNVNFLE